MLQVVRRKPGEGRGALAQRQQKRRHRLGRLQTAAVEIVAKAEGHDTALAQEALKLEFLERQIGQCGDKTRFLGRADRGRRIAETRRH